MALTATPSTYKVALLPEDNVPMRLTAQPEMSENPLDDVVAKAKSTKALNRTAGCDHLIADCEKTIRANRKEYGAP